MKSYQTIIFDLDGTIVNSKPGIIKSFQYALAKFNIKELDLAKFNSFIGPPLKTSFQKQYNFSDSDADKAVEYYREYYREKGIFEHELYDGITNLIKKLKTNKKDLFIATSKLEFFAKQIIEHFGLEKYFEIVAGENPQKDLWTKTDVIEYVLNKAKNIQKEQSIMIGDREHDILGAHENNINSAGVLYGYGSKEELKNAKANYIAKNIKELEEILI